MPRFIAEETLSFDFYLITAPGMVVEAGYAPRVHSLLAFGGALDKDGFCLHDEFGTYAFRHAFATQAKAFDRMMELQSGSITIPDSKKAQPNVAEIKCNYFRGNIFAVRFNEEDYDALKSHAALELLPYSENPSKIRQIRELIKKQYPEFKTPELPSGDTEDGNLPVLSASAWTTMTEDKWQALRAIDFKRHPEDFIESFYQRGFYRCSFHGIAEEVGKDLLFEKKEKPDLVLIAQFRTYYDTYPRPLPPDPAVQRRNLYDWLITFKDDPYVDRVSERNPDYKNTVKVATDYLAAKLS